jgi:hypothetical protein
MAQCSNCKKNLSCGCQKRVASDGKSACSSCIGKYEITKNQNIIKPIQKQTIPIPSNQIK